MANLPCDMCEEEQGVLIVTSLTDGDTTVVGGQCIPGFALQFAASMTEGMPAELWDAYGDAAGKIAANDPRPSDTHADAVSKRSRKSKPPTSSQSANPAGSSSSEKSSADSQPPSITASTSLESSEDAENDELGIDANYDADH